MGICALLVATIIILLIVVVKFYLDNKRYRKKNSVLQVMRISSTIQQKEVLIENFQARAQGNQLAQEHVALNQVDNTYDEYDEMDDRQTDQATG